MSPAHLIAEWAIRSAILIASGALLLWVSRTRDGALRWAAWVALLLGSLMIPAMMLPWVGAPMPGIKFTVPRRLERVDKSSDSLLPSDVPEARVAMQVTPRASVAPVTGTMHVVDWPAILTLLYALVSGFFLLRICTGLWAGSRLLRDAKAIKIEGARESDRVGAPVTLGILRPTIVLPAGWQKWEPLKLDAILAHERSHVSRWDPALQLLSTIHRALLWISPMSWFLHQRIVRAAEDASDDAAIAATRDRSAYAEILFGFMKGGIWSSGAIGVPMARYGNPDRRIRRILEDATLSRGVTKKGLATIVALASPLAYVAATAQTQGQRPAFKNVEIRASAPNTMPQMRASYSGGHYQLLNATMVDLVRTAWNVEADNVVGGPAWVSSDRFDLNADAPANSTPDTLRIALQVLLKDRFQLSARSANRDLPAYVISAGRKPQLEKGDESASGGCAFEPPRASALDSQPVTLVCTNVMIPAFANSLAGLYEASGYLFDYRVLDRTELKGAWNFRIRWTPRGAYRFARVDGETTTLAEAFQRQLGLKLELTKVATPVVVIERVSKPQVTDAPIKQLEFEVTDIRAQDPNTPAPCGVINIQPSGRVQINMTLRNLIWEAWGAPFDFSRILGGSQGMDTPCWTVLAKAPVQTNALGSANAAGWNGALWNGVDVNIMRMMVRSMLIDRFKLEAHLEQRMIDGSALTAPRPKLKPANSANHPGCKEGPGDDGKDPRLNNPLASRLITCRDMTVAEFAGQLNTLFPGSPPFVDQTGLTGRYDMTINFSPAGVLSNSAPARANGEAAAPEPTGAISLQDALNAQLGLKVQARKVSAPVIVVEHVNDTPTEN